MNENKVSDFSVGDRVMHEEVLAFKIGDRVKTDVDGLEGTVYGHHYNPDHLCWYVDLRFENGSTNGWRASHLEHVEEKGVKNDMSVTTFERRTVNIRIGTDKPPVRISHTSEGRLFELQVGHKKGVNMTKDEAIQVLDKLKAFVEAHG